MPVQIPLGKKSLLTASYFDAQGNPSQRLPGVPTPTFFSVDSGPFTLSPTDPPSLNQTWVMPTGVGPGVIRSMDGPILGTIELEATAGPATTVVITADPPVSQ